ncbi:Flavin reductase [Fulvivirga imtechensis AK7]|uniref:Flavin reductase n=1 Tax=Fulvivirga imtechensis AK7 TaxID=1237149 RepID=L8JMP4_9BACT|nr:Flavin reductase [Fulvivirga imtechensis AK7]
MLQALSLGHDVTAFVRSIEKLQDIKHDNLNILKGDVLDPVSVEKAVKGHDAVFCTLGDGRAGKIRAVGTRNIIHGMEKSGAERLICQTTLGAGDSKANLNFFWKYIMFGWFLKKAFLDHELQERYIKDSSVNWTIVRPGAFTDGEVTGKFRHGFSATEKAIKLKISRADVAKFMLQQLHTDQYIQKTPGLSY